MLAGYVSDEYFRALFDVACEFEQPSGSVVAARSSASGAIHADIAPGPYMVTLAKHGYGSKRVQCEIGAEPRQFRLLADTMLGYLWPKWVRSGERSEFRVHAAEPLRLSLWRYGLRKEQVQLLGWFDDVGAGAARQIIPDGDFTPHGAGWNKVGYGSLHHAQLVTAPQRSGLYYVHARGRSGAFFGFPWIVAPRQPQAAIAVLASTNTWNAYNHWGGRSNYLNAAGLPARPVVNARQDLLRYGGGWLLGLEWQFPDQQYPPLSFERPDAPSSIDENAEAGDPIEGMLACHLAAAHWRLLAWLERQGYAYDLYGDAQLHDGVLDLDAYKLLVLGAHPEYWSRSMYERVRDWVERGGRLVYLGGDGITCEVELHSDRMRCKTQLLSQGLFEMADPDDPELRYESRFHRTVEPSGKLLGVVSTETGLSTAGPYRVVRDDHWIFAGTGLAAGAHFGTASQHERYHGGASGHETDKLSRYAPAATVLLAKGVNPDDGGAEMVYLEPGNGAVFSTGSVTYPASLLVDEHISRITANVIDRFLGSGHECPG